MMNILKKIDIGVNSELIMRCEGIIDRAYDFDHESQRVREWIHGDDRNYRLIKYYYVVADAMLEKLCS